MRPKDLEDRLIAFAVDVINLEKFMKNNFASQHLCKQLVRSSTSSALNYGEARSAESPKDFQHKLKICVKELRESFVNLKILKGAKLINYNNNEHLEKLLKENNELISIFVISIRTSKSKNLS